MNGLHYVFGGISACNCCGDSSGQSTFAGDLLLNLEKRPRQVICAVPLAPYFP